MAYYYTGRSGDSFVGATVHANRDCADDPTRPLAESTVESADVTLCPECTDAEPEDKDATDEDTCQEDLSDGGVCGRERPCPYHDKR